MNFPDPEFYEIPDVILGEDYYQYEGNTLSREDLLISVLIKTGNRKKIQHFLQTTTKDLSEIFVCRFQHVNKNILSSLLSSSSG